VKQTNLSDSLANQIETLILEGTLTPGEKLPAERELAARMDVSRPTLRGALQKLAARGLLVTRPGGGTYVNDGLVRSFTEPLSELLKQHSEVDFDVLELRHALEGVAAYYAASRRTEADRASLQARFDEMTAAHGRGDARAEAEADMAFHMTVAEASHNVVLLHVMRGLFTLLSDSIVKKLETLFSSGSPSFEALNAQHSALLDAILAGEPEKARDVAFEHLVYVEDSLREMDQEEKRVERSLRRQTPFAN